MFLQFKIFIFKMLRDIRQRMCCCKNALQKLFRKQPVIFLIGTPEYGNLGDQLIALGEFRWLHDCFPQMRVREFTHEKLMADKGCRMLLSQIRREDVLFLQGGGNINDKYVHCETIRRTVIQKCKKNKIILFPQSVSYADTDAARQMQKETARIYNAHTDLTIITREKTSYLTAQKMFPALRVVLCPDMAAYLFQTLRPSAAFPRSGVVLCIRGDEEAYYPREELRRLAGILSSGYEVYQTDTNIHRPIVPQKRQTAVQAMIDALAKGNVVVTDRFHGVIFSVLARTPCVALRSCDHKITDGIKWFADVPWVYYADNLQDVPALVERAHAAGAGEPPDFRSYFTQLFDELHLNF